MFSDCKDKGYKIAFESEVPESGRGYYIPLVIVDNPPYESRVVREERTYRCDGSEACLDDLALRTEFGPIIPLLRWNNDEDVVRRASAYYIPSQSSHLLSLPYTDDSEFGLGSSIWGRDIDRMERMADKLDNGMGQSLLSQPVGLNHTLTPARSHCAVWINEWATVGGHYVSAV